MARQVERLLSQPALYQALVANALQEVQQYSSPEVARHGYRYTNPAIHPKQMYGRSPRRRRWLGRKFNNINFYCRFWILF